jgi:Flp pilus assembly protein TadG
MMYIRTGFRKNAEGATAIEYAIILPVLIWLVMGIIEYNCIMYGSAVLEGALNSAAREGKTGYVNATAAGICPSPVVNGTVSPQTQSSYINCLVGYHVGGLLDTTKLQISYNDTNTGTFNAATDAPTVSATPCTNNAALANPPSLPLCSENSQNAGDIVLYTVTYPWNIITPVMQNFLGTGGVYTLTASAIVKNEPYTSGSTR